MYKQNLDQEEQALLEVFEAYEFESDLTDERKAYLTEAVEAVFKKDKRITIRISSRDLEEGLPCQTLVASALHKYASGSLRDLSANKHSKA